MIKCYDTFCQQLATLNFVKYYAAPTFPGAAEERRRARLRARAGRIPDVRRVREADRASLAIGRRGSGGGRGAARVPQGEWPCGRSRRSGGSAFAALAFLMQF